MIHKRGLPLDCLGCERGVGKWLAGCWLAVVGVGKWPRQTSKAPKWPLLTRTTYSQPLPTSSPHHKQPSPPLPSTTYKQKLFPT